MPCRRHLFKELAAKLIKALDIFAVAYRQMKSGRPSELIPASLETLQSEQIMPVRAPMIWR